MGVCANPWKKTEKFTAKTTTTTRNEEESDMRTVCVCV
jgi:hypothetical protein